MFLYMSITVYSFDKLLFEKNEVFCVLSLLQFFRESFYPGPVFTHQHNKHRHVFVIGVAVFSGTGRTLLGTTRHLIST